MTKPPGAYAAIGLASLPFARVTEETARLPSAFAASFAVLFAFSTLRNVLGDGRAFAAAMLLPVSFLWLDKVPSAEIDMLQLAWVVAAILSFWRAVDANDRQQTAWKWWVASLLCVAGGFLTKWTAPAFFYLAVGPYLWQLGRLRRLFGQAHLLGVVLAVVVCGGWAVLAAAEVGWPVLSNTIYQEAAQRFAPGAHGKSYPWRDSLAFPAVFLGANLPWSIPALLALRPSVLRSLNDRERRLVQLLHCWAWPNLLFWSLPAQHHVRYSLPICPAITLLGVIVICQWLKGIACTPRKIAFVRVAFLSVIATWVIAKVGYVESIIPARTANRNARETAEQLGALVPNGQVLYLCRLKDEGVLFYYGRPVRRSTCDHVGPEVQFLLLLDDEWQSGRFRHHFVHVAELRDQQGAAMHLLRRPLIVKDGSGWQPPDPPTRPTSSRSPP